MVLSENGPIEAFLPRALLQYIRIWSDSVHRVRKRGDLRTAAAGNWPSRVPPLYSLHGPSKSVFSKNSQGSV